MRGQAGNCGVLIVLKTLMTTMLTLTLKATPFSIITSSGYMQPSSPLQPEAPPIPADATPAPPPPPPLERIILCVTCLVIRRGRFN